MQEVKYFKNKHLKRIFTLLKAVLVILYQDLRKLER